MANGIQCPNCGYENSADARFCQGCGKSVVMKCPRCGTENSLEAKFCKGCGISLENAAIGLNLTRAQQWADYFTKQGFGLHPSWIEAFDVLLQEGGDPQLGENREIIILPMLISNKDAWIRTVEFHLGPENIWRINRGAMLVTSWRFLVIDDQTNEWGAWFYDNLKDIEINKQILTLRSTKDNIIKIYFALPKPGFGSFMLAAVTDSIAKTRSGSRAFYRARAETDAIYAEVVRFFVEICNSQ